MRELGPVQWRFIGDEAKCRELTGEARAMLGVLRATLGENVTTGALRRTIDGTARIHVALINGIPLATIEAGAEEITTTQQREAIYFALFEMLRGSSPPTLGTNANSLLLKVGAEPKWYRAAADAAVYPSVGRYPQGVLSGHALHQSADRKGHHTVSCGYSAVSYMADPGRVQGVAVDGLLITSAVAGSGFSERCLSPKIIKVAGDFVTFAFLSAPPAGALQLIVARHNVATKTTRVITVHDASGVVVAHPVFGFYFTASGHKCCGVVLANGAFGLELKEVDFSINLTDYSVSSSVATASFSYTSTVDYEAQIGAYYDGAGVKTPVTLKNSITTEGSVTDDTIVYSETVTHHFNIFGSSVTYSPDTAQDVNYLVDTVTYTEASLYRGDDKWFSLFIETKNTDINFAYSAKIRFTFNEAGDTVITDSVVGGGTGDVIGHYHEDKVGDRVARLCYANPQTGSHLILRSRYTTANDYDYADPADAFPTWLPGSSMVITGTSGADTTWAANMSAKSSTAVPDIINAASSSNHRGLAHVINLAGVETVIDVDDGDLPSGIENPQSSNYPFSLNSYFVPYYQYLPIRYVPPSFTGTENCDTQAKYCDYLMNVMEYWGFMDKRIAKNETMANGRTRFLTNDQYDNHLIGTGAVYELVENGTPLTFVALNTYDGVRAFLNGADITSTLPAGGSDTFVPTGAM